MDDEYEEPPFVHLEQGARSASIIDVKVSHDLGDRTLVVVILLACVIGVCGVVMGMNLAKQSMQEQYVRDVAVKQQIMINHVNELESLVKEKSHAD